MAVWLGDIVISYRKMFNNQVQVKVARSQTKYVTKHGFFARTPVAVYLKILQLNCTGSVHSVF